MKRRIVGRYLSATICVVTAAIFIYMDANRVPDKELVTGPVEYIHYIALYHQSADGDATDQQPVGGNITQVNADFGDVDRYGTHLGTVMFCGDQQQLFVLNHMYRITVRRTKSSGGGDTCHTIIRIVDLTPKRDDS
jgi:hypothetical protein